MLAYYAFLAYGWVLLVPPSILDLDLVTGARLLQESPYRFVDTSAPLSQWTPFQAHDTAEECQAQKTRLIVKVSSRTSTQVDGEFLKKAEAMNRDILEQHAKFRKMLETDEADIAKLEKSARSQDKQKINEMKRGHDQLKQKLEMLEAWDALFKSATIEELLLRRTREGVENSRCVPADVYYGQQK